MQTASENPASADTSDLGVARRIIDGDRDALVTLMRRYNQKLYRTARSILRDDGEAEEAVQDAWILAWRAMASFRADARLSTWLVRIAANEALARLRKQRRRAEVIWLSGDAKPDDEDTQASDVVDPNSESPEHAALRSQTRRLIEEHIDRLPDAFRTVFVLRALEELTVEEVADCLAIPEATVRSRYFRARGLLRASLAGEIDLCVDQAFSFAGARCDRIVAGVLARL